MLFPRDLRLITYFVQIVRAGSIRKAAEQMSRSPAVVSEALSDLEAILGVTLLKRSTRSMSTTEAGRRFFEKAAIVTDAAEQAYSELTAVGQPPSGLVKLTLAVELSIAWLPPLLRKFEEKYPDVRVEVHADDEVTKLSTSQYDIAIRATTSEKAVSGESVCVCDPLVLVCSPEKIGKGTESFQECISRVGLIGTTANDSDIREITAYERRSSKKSRKKSMKFEAKCRFVVNSQVVARKLAIEGFGAALLLNLSIKEDLAAGKLVHVDKKYEFGYVIARIVSRDKYPSLAARELRRFLMENQQLETITS